VGFCVQNQTPSAVDFSLLIFLAQLFQPVLGWEFSSTLYSACDNYNQVAINIKREALMNGVIIKKRKDDINSRFYRVERKRKVRHRIWCRVLEEKR
jgi:hypothetical protein